MKKHFKMYKHGKQWCVMFIAAITLTMGVTTGAKAADNSQQLCTSQLNELNTDNINNDEKSSLLTNNLTVDNSNKQNSQVEEQQQKDTNDKQSSIPKNGWVQESTTQGSIAKQWTYYDHGQVTKGRNYSYLPTIGKNDGSHNWYLVDNGVVQSGVQKWADTYYDFDPVTYLRVDNNYVQSQWGDWYLFGNDGRIQTKVQKWAGTYYYFDPVTYLRVDNDYRQSQWGDWYLFGGNGTIQTGVHRWMGSVYYFDPVTYLKVTNAWRDGLYFGSDGRLVNGNFSTRVVNWFLQRENKLTYSMYGSRTGRDGTADCSGSMTMALWNAGASYSQIIYSTETIHNYLLNNGYYLAYEGQSQPASLRYGDVIIWGHKAASLGGNGHTMVATGTGDYPTVISTCYLTEGEPGTAVQEVNYNSYWNDDNKPYQYVYRLKNAARN